MDNGGFWQQMMAQFAAHQGFYGAIARVFAAIIGSLLLWLVFRHILKVVFRSLEAYAFFRENLQTLEIIRQGLSFVLLLALGMYLIEITGLHAVRRVFYAIMVVLFASPLCKMADVALSFLRTRVATQTQTRVDDIVFDLLHRFSNFIIYIGAIVFSLDLLGLNVMPIVAGAGIVGVAIGFAAKDTLSNIIAGVLLLIDRPFEEGDRIEVWNAPKGSATWGDVVNIGLRATKIKTTDNIFVVIPNNQIMTRDIINYTCGDESIRVRITIGVGYDADIAKAKAIILDVAGKCHWVMNNPPPQVVVRSFGESSVELQARVWIKNARRRMDTISQITDSVKMCFFEQGIEIPYPRRDIVIRYASGHSPMPVLEEKRVMEELQEQNPVTQISPFKQKAG